jgi:hypothetical protein
MKQSDISHFKILNKVELKKEFKDEVIRKNVAAISADAVKTSKSKTVYLAIISEK